jgi:hypothetical protein
MVSCEQLSADLAQFPEIAVIALFFHIEIQGRKAGYKDCGKELNTSHLITAVSTETKNI